MYNAVSVNKATQLLQGLQSTGNEGQQLTAVIEMCQVSDHECRTKTLQDKSPLQKKSTGTKAQN